jgi:hypothetical protein
MKKRSHIDNRFHRSIDSGEQYEIIRDIHLQLHAEVCYVKCTGSRDHINISLNLLPGFNILQHFSVDAIGTVIHGIENKKAVTIWIPREPARYIFDGYDRVRPITDAPVESDWNFNAQILLSVSGSLSEKETVLLPYIKFMDPDLSYFRELSEYSDNERKHYRRSVWFFASSVGSLWDYMIHGSLYDPRLSKTNRSRFKCQQCAYAWWKYLQKNLSETGKNIYELLRNEVAYSILLDLDEDGGWRHGYWSDDMETHARFHLDGIDLFLSQYALTSDEIWLEESRRSMSYVFSHLTDKFDDGSLWFLHDTMEEKKRHWIQSTVFGKSPKNSLCLNTHIQALRILYQLSEYFPGETIYLNSYESGMGALKQVLEHQPADFLYRLVIHSIIRKRKNDGSIIKKLITRITSNVTYRLYWYLQEKYPRLVQPGGFIERDLSITMVSLNYQITNIKDLLKLYDACRADWLREYIVEGVSFLRKLIKQFGLRSLIRTKPYYVEVIDIFSLYANLIERLPSEYITSIENEIFKEINGYSLEHGKYSPGADRLETQ